MLLHRRQHRVPVQATEGVPQIQSHKSGLRASASHLSSVAKRFRSAWRPDPKLARSHGLGQELGLGSSKAFACKSSQRFSGGHRAKPAVLLSQRREASEGQCCGGSRRDPA